MKCGAQQMITFDEAGEAQGLLTWDKEMGEGGLWFWGECQASNVLYCQMGLKNTFSQSLRQKH